jgi:hypothetical protein
MTPLSTFVKGFSGTPATAPPALRGVRPGSTLNGSDWH